MIPPLTSHSSTNESFQPSLASRVLSEITAPRTLVTGATLGAAILVGASLPFAVAAAGLGFAAQQIATKVLSGGDVLRSAAFVEADYLSILSIRGGLPTITIPPILETLGQMPSEDAQVAANCLEGLLNYENQVDFMGINNTVLVNELIEHVNQLQPGQKAALSFSFMNSKGGGHIVIGSIERKENGKSIVRFHNGGLGLDYHYERREAETDNTIYQTTLEVDEVDEENLIPFIRQVCALHAFRPDHDESKLYQSILLLKGKILPPSSDPRLWSRVQEGMSCSGYSLRCFLQSILTPKTLHEFDIRFLTDSTAKLKEGIKNGWFWDQTAQHMMAYQELRGRLIRMGGEDPGPLEEALPSRMSDLTSKAQKTFWGLFFPPPIFSGLCYNEFERIGAVHFEELHASFIDTTDFNINFSRSVEEKKAAISKFQEQFDLFCKDLDRSLFSEDDLKIIDKHSEEGYQQLALQHIYKTLFSNLDYTLHDEGAVKLLKAIDHLKRKDFPKARKKLEKVYHLTNTLQNISSETAKDYAHAMIHMLYLRTPTEELEDLELRAAATAILTKLKDKVADKKNKYFTHTTLFYNSLKFYRNLRLDKEFPESPWVRDIFDLHAQSQAEYLPYIKFDPVPGDKLKSLLKQMNEAG